MPISSPREKGARAHLSAPVLLLVILVLTSLTRLVPMPQGRDAALTTIVLNLLIFALPAIFYLRLGGEDYRRSLNLRLIGPGKLPIILFGFFILVCGSALINYLLYKGGAIAFGQSETAGNFARLLTGSYDGPGDVLLTSLAFAIVPAVAEEFFFRCVFFCAYERYGALAQVLLSSLAFALAHLSLPRFPVFFFCGIFLSLLAFVTRSVLSSMVLHALFNLFAIFGEKYLWNFLGNQNSTIFFLFLLGTVLLAFLAFFFGESERLFRAYAVEGVPSRPERERAEERRRRERELARERETGTPALRPPAAGTALSGGKITHPLARALFSPTFLLCAAYVIVIIAVGKG